MIYEIIILIGILILFYKLINSRKIIIKKMEVDDNINILIDDFFKNMKNNIELNKFQNKMKIIKIIEYTSYIIMILYLFSPFISYLLFLYSFSIGSFQNKIFNFDPIEKPYLLLLSIPLLIVFLSIYLYSEKNYKKYKELVKKYIYNQFLKNLKYNLKWYDEQPEPEDTYSKLKTEYKIANFNIIQHNTLATNELYFEDYISGIYKEKVIISIADFNEYIGRKSSNHSLYAGIFCKVKLNKEILNDIRITNDKKRISFLEKKYMVTTMPEKFNNNFIILANDEYPISNCISSKVIEIVEEFYDNSKIKFDISIINDEIFFRFRTIDSMEPHIWKNIVDELMLKEYANIIMFVIKLSEEINNIS